MDVNVEIRYSVRQFMGDFLGMYGSFSQNNLYKYVKTMLNMKSDDNDDIDECEKYVSLYRVPFYLKWGASKVCLNFVGTNYVIKIPYGTHDYCMDEVINYGDAKEYGVEWAFAEEVRLFKYRDFYVYAQVEVETSYEQVMEESVDEMDCVDRNTFDIIQKRIESDDYSSEVEQLLEFDKYCVDLVNCYGEENFWDLMAFISENSINDLHEGNIGYNSKGFPVIFDYSGF